jgi:hypothetical protein
MYSITNKALKEVRVIENKLYESHIQLPKDTHAVKLLYH